MTFDDPKQQRRTIIEQGTSFRGSLSSTCPIDVHGSIEGDIQTPALAVSASGRVHGSARVGSVSSEGELSGEFDAESVELAGRVRDNTVIRARSLNVRLGSERGKLQVIFGECELAIGDEPAESVKEGPAIVAPAVLESPPPLVTEQPQTPAIAEAASASNDSPVMADAVEQPAAAVAPSPQATDNESSDADSGDSSTKQRNGRRERKSGWSHPPSQPPPAS